MICFVKVTFNSFTKNNNMYFCNRKLYRALNKPTKYIEGDLLIDMII